MGFSQGPAIPRNRIPGIDMGIGNRSIPDSDSKIFEFDSRFPIPIPKILNSIPDSDSKNYQIDSRFRFWNFFSTHFEINNWYSIIWLMDSNFFNHKFLWIFSNLLVRICKVSSFPRFISSDKYEISNVNLGFYPARIVEIQTIHSQQSRIQSENE